ncbi:MAG: HAMP domain-containing protein [Deltaproteobacteria bacterium]|nr:HAMP domain-containing protein [Deltaproteobacteria bacterium]MCL5891581.1 HAMP domain-containing protein [Deltaproteobacteria bacterium]
MTIKAKLILIELILIIGFGIIWVFTYTTTSTISKDMKEMAAYNLNYGKLQNLRGYMYKVAAASRQIIIIPSKKLPYKQYVKATNGIIKLYPILNNLPGGLVTKGLFIQFISHTTKAVNFARAGNKNMAIHTELLATAHYWISMRKHLATMLNAEFGYITLIHKTVNNEALTLNETIFIMVIIFILTLVVVITLLSKGIIKPIEKLTEHATQISLGKSTDDFIVKSNDEIGKLAIAFNRLKKSYLKAVEMLIKSKSNHNQP